MRWKTSYKPKHRDEKTENHFALIPTEMSDGTVVWLEWYQADYVYHQFAWDYGAWVSVRKRAKND